MVDALILWSHALAALLFAALALWSGRRAETPMPRWPLVTALGAAALWALSLAALGATDPATRLADGMRGLALLALTVALYRRVTPGVTAGVATVHGVTAAISIVAVVLQLAASGLVGDPRAADVSDAAALLRMMASVAALVLVQNLHSAATRGDVRLLCWALAVIWLSQLVLAGGAYLETPWLRELQMVRGFAIVGAAGIVAAAFQRVDRGPLYVSRTVAYQSLSVVAVGGYFALIAIVTSALSALGGSARIYQTAFVFGSTAAVLTLLGSPWLRAWIKVKVAKHLFRHRYDYRAEWLRFTGTLGDPSDVAPLDQRIVKAVADLTDSPAGLLLVPDGDALGVGAGWNWAELPRGGAGSDFAAYLAASERIVELDQLRRGACTAAELSVVPQWMLDDADGWAVVPLIHLGRLVGAIVLGRPAVDRALDWEDFDLLRVAGRQVASYLAEARALDALAQGQRFEEFNRRFAFIVHDIKNLVSGLSLVARNAERHAENPEFRADMVATLKDSATKLNALLARLTAAARAPTAQPVAVELRQLAERIAGQHRLNHQVVVSGDATTRGDPAAVEQLVGHLVRNAIEASDASEPVTIALEDEGATVALSVIDRGCGMSPAFVREQLFRPFASSKPAGFGIGAFEARQLAQAMGGTIEVDSREGEGSRFRVVLPAAQRSDLGVAA